jgi:TolB protein
VNLSGLVRRLVVAFGLACSAPALAQNIDLGGHIAYVTPYGQLGIVDPSGGEPRLLSAMGPSFQFPAFDPDGDRIAAIGTGDTAGTVSIFDGTSEVVAYRSEAERPIYLYWSPDGRTLSFLAARAETGLGFWLAADGAEPRLAGSGNPFYWAWNPDARSFLVHVGLTGDGSRLAFGSPDAGLSDEDLDPPGWFQAPGIAPSGRYVAYGLAGPAGSRRVVVASHPHVAGEVVRREFRHDGFAMLGWHPTQDLLAVMAPPQPAPHWFGPIQILDAADGLLAVVVDDVALAFFWSPDGSKMAYVTPVPSDGGQRIADAPGADEHGDVPSHPGAMEDLVPSSSVSNVLASSTGTLRAVASARIAGAELAESPGSSARSSSSSSTSSGQPSLIQQGPVEFRLRVVHLDGASVDRVTTIATITPSPLWLNQFLPFFDQYALSHRVWSPASDALVVPVLGSDGASRVVVFGLDGSRREVAIGDMPFWNVR